MKRIFISLLILATFLSLPISNVKASASYLSVSLSYSPTSIYPGDSFTINALVTNHKYRKEYEEDDVILSNMQVLVNFDDNSKYIVPQTEQWELPLSSMEDDYKLTFSKTFVTSEDTPPGNFFITVESYTDKDDPSTLDHETQGQPLVILEKMTSDNNESSTNSNQNQESTQNEGEDQQIRVQLHERFLKDGSSTTRIDEMNQEQLRNVERFTIEEMNKNKVEFKNNMDLSSEETVEKMNNLTEYIDLSSCGKVTIDADSISVFNSPATITMLGLEFDREPDIYKDGKLATSDQVTNVSYSYSEESKGTLTFDVVGFSTYEAREIIEDEQSTVTSDQYGSDDFNTTVLLLIIGGITMAGIVIVIIIKLRQEKKFNLKPKETDKKTEEASNMDTKEEKSIEK